VSVSPRVAAPLYLTLSLLAGCSQAPESALDDEPASQVKTQRVYGGMPSTEEYDAVVQVSTDDSFCSGTMVAPRLVVTARHCVSPYVDGTYQCSVDGGYSSAVPRSPGDAGTVGLAYPPETVKVTYGQFPFDKEPAIGEKIYTVSTDTICRNDIAIVRLDRELPVPLRPMRLKDPTYPGELVTVVGYGFTDTDVAGRHERHDVEILDVGKSPIYPEGHGSFDRTFRLGQAACPGDSGGPTVAKSGAILGVFSIIQNDCTGDGAENYYTQLAPYRSFIEAAFEDSGFDVLYEDTGSNSGSGGSAGASSDSDGSGESGGSKASGGSAGGTTTSGIIPGRRKKDDGCSFGATGDDEGRGWAWSSLLLGLVALRRRAQR